MAVGKRNRRFPVEIKDLDFSTLHNSQYWILADWMNCRRQVTSKRKEASGDARLREICLADLPRAQEGYEIIILGKRPEKTESADRELEKRMTGVLTDVLSNHRETIGDETAKALTSQMEQASKRILQLAQAAVNDAAMHTRPIVIKDGGKTRKVKGILPPEFEIMVKLAKARIPILMVGPAGCGKTFLCEKLGEALDLVHSDQSCSEGMSESVFNGVILPIGKAGAFDHVPSPFMERYENGGVMLLDEIDAGDPNLFTYINKAIANESYTAAQRWKKPVIQKHDDFVLVAAANTFGHGADAMYVGRNQLDAATIDRFKVGTILMDYNREVELSLGTPELCEWAWKVRDKIRANKLRRIMSTRVIKDLGVMTRLYQWTEKEWKERYFTGWSDADLRAVL